MLAFCRETSGAGTLCCQNAPRDSLKKLAEQDRAADRVIRKRGKHPSGIRVSTTSKRKDMREAYQIKAVRRMGNAKPLNHLKESCIPPQMRGRMAVLGSYQVPPETIRGGMLCRPLVFIR